MFELVYEHKMLLLNHSFEKFENFGGCFSAWVEYGVQAYELYPYAF